MKPGQFPKTETSLVAWMHEARAANMSLSGTLLKIKAKHFAEKVGESDFVASNGWLHRFRKRHGIVYRKINGEAKSVDMSKVEEFRNTVPAQLLKDYRPEDIYNADETGLIWANTSNKTLTFKTDDCTGKKVSKVRVTIKACVNMTGTHKKRLFVIGKAKEPRSFKNKSKLPITYRNNKKSWMTAGLFEEWLLKWNRKLVEDGRHIALVLDNATCHPDIPLSNIKLVYLPPNTTSHTQPLDAGIIANFKSHYRHLYTLGVLCPALEAGESPNYELYDAIEVMIQAWDLVRLYASRCC